MLFFTSLVVAAVTFGKLRSWCEEHERCVSEQGRFAPGLIREQFVDTLEELRPRVHECLGGFSPCLAPAFVPWMLLKMLFLLSPLKTGPWQSHGKGFSSPGEHVPGERSRRRFPSGWERTGMLGLTSTCRNLLQGWRWILLSSWFS